MAKTWKTKLLSIWVLLKWPTTTIIPIHHSYSSMIHIHIPAGFYQELISYSSKLISYQEFTNEATTYMCD